MIMRDSFEDGEVWSATTFPGPRRLPASVLEREAGDWTAHLADADGDAGKPILDGKLLFWIEGALYASPLPTLREALPVIPAFTLLPFSPPWLIGVFPMRTDLVTLIDPRPFLGERAAGVGAYGAQPSPNNKQALLVGESGWPMAILVDRIGDIIRDGAGQVASASVEATACDLTALSADIGAQLEVWARNV